jgi:hypothetical protein
MFFIALISETAESAGYHNAHRHIGLGLAVVSSAWNPSLDGHRDRNSAPLLSVFWNFQMIHCTAQIQHNFQQIPRSAVLLTQSGNLLANFVPI